DWELLRPLWKRVTQRRPEVGVRIVVGQDVHAAIPRGLPQRLDLLRLPDSAVLRIVVADLDGTPRALANLDALPDRVDDRLPLPPDVRRVEPSMAGDDVREFDDFVRPSEASGRIHQARAHAERAGAHRFVDVAFHRPQFVPRRRPFLE